MKKIENDPHYDKAKAIYLLKSFVGLHEHAIEKKLEIIVEHFLDHVMNKISGNAKAMIVARSRLHAALAPVVDRYIASERDEKADFRGQLTDYVRLYAFLSQIITFVDAELEKLYVFARLLLRKLPPDRGTLPTEVQQAVDMDSYRLEKRASGRIRIERGVTELEPIGPKGGYTPVVENLEPLSQILKELNDRFGTSFTEEDRVFIQQLEARLTEDQALEASLRANPRDNVRLTLVT